MSDLNHRKQALGELASIVAALRKEAKEKSLNTMTLREINRVVATARPDLMKTSTYRHVACNPEGSRDRAKEER